MLLKRSLAAAIGLIVFMNQSNRSEAQSSVRAHEVARQYPTQPVTRGWVTGNVRAVRNAAALGLYRICVPNDRTDGDVSQAIVANLDYHGRIASPRGVLSADLAIVEAMAELYPCR